MFDKKSLGRLKKILILVAIVVGIIYIGNKLLMMSKFDNSYPEISFAEETLKVSVNVTEEELLEGVKAVDKKDGDVTDTIVIESMSKLLDGNCRTVTYAAFDKDDHVGKAERKIQYTDYTPIRFALSEPLVSDTGLELSEILAPLTVTDCIDGDISSQAVVVNRTTESYSDDNYLMIFEVQVTNSCGEVANMKLPIRMNNGEEEVSTNSHIELDKYLIYTKVGKKVDLEANIKNVVKDGVETGNDSVKIKSEIDTAVPGAYIVTYSMKAGEAKVYADLVVVVEE